jgi:hypothetical protein
VEILEEGWFTILEDLGELAKQVNAKLDKSTKNEKN